MLEIVFAWFGGEMYFRIQDGISRFQLQVRLRKGDLRFSSVQKGSYMPPIIKNRSFRAP